MLVTLIGKKSIHKIVLPQTTVGNYWITDKTEEKEKKLVNIEGKAGKWQVVSNNYVKVINSKFINVTNNSISVIPSREKVTERVILQEYSMYGICIGNLEELYILYCSPVYENSFEHLNIKNTKEIYIGSNNQNHIEYNNILVKNTHARIYKDSGRWVIENLDNRFGTFVNNMPIFGETKILFNGDVIFIMGLKVIMMGNSIFINNPQNAVRYNSKYFELDKTKYVIDKTQSSEDIQENIELYSDKEYFSRAPRIKNIIETEKVKIDAPPQIQDKEDTPAILVLGSTLAMGLMMMISIITTIDGRISGTATAKDTAFSLAMAVAMLISIIVFPILNVKYDKRRKKRYEEKRQKRYTEYLNKKRKVIEKIMSKQKAILFENYVSAEECTKIILEKGPRLWERKIEDYDFLQVRLGIGDVPLKIEIQYPEESFAMEDDNLVDILNDIAEKSKTLKDAPIVTSLIEKDVVALVVKNNETFKKFMQSLIVQLIAFHSYEDLKLVFLLKKDNDNYWDYVKMLPHVWNNTKQIRFYADNYEDMKEVSKYLEDEMKERMQYDENMDYRAFSPYYLIITDDYTKIENLRIITEMLKSKKNLGFSLLCITEDMTQLPNECKTFITLENNTGVIFDSEISSNNQRKITFDTSFTIFFEKICQTISNIPIRYMRTGSGLLPNTYTFLEMYDVGLIEQLNVLERWRKNDSTLSLKAPIGIDSSGMPIVLDIHEKMHGPHGLIAGSTGSGKSEFIITYILSLAINYQPDDVTFLLIDYKGGGLAGAFSKGQIKLPHLVGTITNIDTIGLQRSLASIQSELKRRQIKFNEARNMIDEGTIDIYKYQKLYHEGIIKEPIPHLLIICDEFAELKQQQEEFMDELISVSRIGRSLGVHLILATQKPAGIVNDQIRSNSKFAICLKVQDREDSMDVIKKPDAASLRGAGQFYMQVGNDDYFVLGQSAWSGAPYYPSDMAKRKIDNSIQFISNIGAPIKEVADPSQKVISSKGEQLTNIVKYIYHLAKQEQIQTHNLWLDSIPKTIFVEDLKKKYHVKDLKDGINVILGEYDDPYNQRQGLVNLNLLNVGNIVVYGNAESGKETLLGTIIYNLITSYDATKVIIYALDFGSEALKIYRNAPQVGDVVLANENEKISRFFDMIQKEIKDRKETLSNYNGDYELFVKTGNKPMPMMVVILNNYEAFSEITQEEYEDIFLTITREGAKCGIIFITTVSVYNAMRYRLTQNFKKKIVLQLNNEDDYFNIFDKIGKKRPSHIFGRGLITIDSDEIYEFQTAKICEQAEYNAYVQEIINTLDTTEQPSAPSIPIIPDKITLKDFEPNLKDIQTLPIGLTKKQLKIATYDFTKRLMNIIVSKNLNDAVEFLYYVIEEIKKLQNLNIVILNAEIPSVGQKEKTKIEYQNFVKNFEKNKQNTLCIIIGIDKFINEFVEDTEFNEVLKTAEEIGLYNFIIVETVNKLKNHEYDNWYKSYVSNDFGIYVGNGIDDQYLISIDDRQDLVNNCGRSYGYIVRQGIPTLIKLLGMRESSDDNG